MANDRKDIPKDDAFWELGTGSRGTSHIPTVGGTDKALKVQNGGSAQSVGRSISTSAVEINVGEPDRVQSAPAQVYSDARISTGETITKYVNPKNPASDKKLILEYQPKNPLISSVKIFTDTAADSVFARDNLFMRERRALLERIGKPATHVPYYSLMPRYSQMTRQQLAYYLWWRENIRHGVWLEADLSYALLYAHELISDESDSDKHESLRALCRLYSAQANGRSMSYFGIGSLISDFCLINGIHPRPEYFGGDFPKFIKQSSLPELFIDLSDRDDPALSSALLENCSLYNYKKTKHYAGNEKLFDGAMSGAIRELLAQDRSYAALTAASSGAYGLIRAGHKPFYSIQGLTCKNAKIEICYHSLSSLTNILTDALRYVDNKLRDHLSIRSKLNITTVNPELRAVIDEYMARNYPPPSRASLRERAEKREEETYAKFYDVPKTELSLESALEIEKRSWEITKTLVEAFDDPVGTGVPDGPLTHTTTTDKPVETDPISACPSETNGIFSQISQTVNGATDFITACLDGDILGQRACASSLGKTPDEIAEQINELALELIGDILLEDTDGGYAVIEDYKELIL